MKKEGIVMKRKMYFGILFLGLFCVISFSLVTYARSNTIKKEYANILITCSITCTSSSGSGSTEGATMDGLRNYVKVVTYDINQVSLGAAEKYSILAASASVTNGRPYLARTFHAVADTNNIQLLPIYQQIQQAQGRD